VRIKHRIPVDHLRLTDEVTPEYQAEVDRHTARLEREYRAAEARLVAAEERAKRIDKQTASRATRKAHERDSASAWALVDLCRLELEKFERMMQAVPASSQHRSRAAHRPVPFGDSGRLL
jgi:hypothetical protein